MPLVIETWESRKGTFGGEKQSATFSYLFRLNGGEDESAIDTWVIANAPLTYREIPRKDYTIEPKGGVIFLAVVNYDSKEAKKPGDSLFSFDTTSGKQKVYNSIDTPGNYAPDGEFAPDFQKCINVNEGKVEGAEIVIPQFNFSLTRYIAPADMTETYQADLYDLTGKVNSDTITIVVAGVSRTFAPGTLLFYGATGSQRGAEDWEIKLSFGASPNVEDLTIGEIEGIEKEGWDFLWVLYEKQEDEDTHVIREVPTAVYVEQVYERDILMDLLVDL